MIQHLQGAVKYLWKGIPRLRRILGSGGLFRRDGRNMNRWKSRLFLLSGCSLILSVMSPAAGAGPGSQDFIVDGLALGTAVYPESIVYKSYACRPSQEFGGFTWCARHRERSGKFGPYTSWVTLLHSSSNRVVFITEAIVPAFFSPGDADHEIARISKGFGEAAQTLTAEVKPGVSHAISGLLGRCDANAAGRDGHGCATARRGNPLRLGR